MLEATGAAFSQGMEVVLLVIAVVFYLKEVGLRRLSWFFLGGALLALLVGFAGSFLLAGGSSEAEFLVVKGHLFIAGGLLLFSLLSLSAQRLQFFTPLEKAPSFIKPLPNFLTGFIPFKEESGEGRFLTIVTFLGGFALFLLEGFEISSSLKNIAFTKESPLPYFFGFWGFVLAGLAAWGLIWLAGRIRLGRFFNFSGLLFFIVAVKALWEPELILSLEVIVARIFHDLIHSLIVLLLVPDHPYLKVSFWNLIGLLFRKNTGLLVALTALLATGFLLLLYFLRASLPELKAVKKGAERRRIWAQIKRERRRQSLAILVAFVVFWVVGYSAYSSEKAVFKPTPRPLLDDAQGYAQISLLEVSDGLMHKYLYAYSGKIIRFIVIKKPDGSFAVTLDSCFICPPDGYGQLGRDFFCLYCGTPIPIATVGQFGACNPVPIPFKIIGSKLRFSARKAVTTWENVNQGK